MALESFSKKEHLCAVKLVNDIFERKISGLGFLFIKSFTISLFPNQFFYTSEYRPYFLLNHL